MGNYDFLPLDKTARLIQTFAEHPWPLQKEEFETIFSQCALSLQMRDPHTYFQTFTINRSTYAGSIATLSYGISRISFHPCDYPQTMGNAEAAPIANQYMLALADKLSEYFGHPRTYHDEGDSSYFAWWRTSALVTVKISYGSSLPTITIAAPSQSEDPADVLALPSSERCVELVRAWADSEWPMSVPDVHQIAEELGWIPEEASSHSFYSELPGIMYACQPPCIVGEYTTEPDVSVNYRRNSAGQIDFVLSDYLSIRSEADAFPAITQRMREVESELITIYGEPTRSSSFGTPFRSQWSLANGATLTLSYGQGQSHVRIRHDDTMNSEVAGYPTVYKITHALEVLVNWGNAITSMQLEDALTFAKDIGWFPADENNPSEFYTPVSLPGQASAHIVFQNNQLEYVHFIISHLVVKGVEEPHPDNANAAVDIATALSDEYGEPVVLYHHDVEYRDWQTPSGSHIRLAWNTTKAEAWIYTSHACTQIDSLTAPLFTPGEESATPHTTEPKTGLNTIQKIAFVLLGSGLITYGITLLF